MTSAIFGSPEFSDDQILTQLTSLEHQILLSEHGAGEAPVSG
jgi:hypothetical protein